MDKLLEDNEVKIDRRCIKTAYDNAESEGNGKAAPQSAREVDLVGDEDAFIESGSESESRGVSDLGMAYQIPELKYYESK